MYDRCIFNFESAEVWLDSKVKLGYELDDVDNEDSIKLFTSFVNPEFQILNIGEYESVFGLRKLDSDFGYEIFVAVNEITRGHSLEFSTRVSLDEDEFDFKVVANNDLQPNFLPQGQFTNPSFLFQINLDLNNKNFVTLLNGEWIFNLLDMPQQGFSFKGLQGAFLHRFVKLS